MKDELVHAVRTWDTDELLVPTLCGCSGIGMDRTIIYSCVTCVECKRVLKEERKNVMSACKKCGKKTGPVFGMCATCIRAEDSQEERAHGVASRRQPAPGERAEP
jgi:hypothetical protein